MERKKFIQLNLHAAFGLVLSGSTLPLKKTSKKKIVIVGSGAMETGLREAKRIMEY